MASCCDSESKKGEAKAPESGGCCAPREESAPTSGCCDSAAKDTPASSCCPTDGATGKARPDYLLWVSGAIVLANYLVHLLLGDAPLPHWLAMMSGGIFELVNRMWWGVLAAVVFVGVLDRIPRELIMSALGQGGSLRGIARATLAGVLLDLCSHGILMVGTKLYERGASIGQVMAFLLASPWNSLSLTIILAALIGLKWTLAFIALSMLIGIATGWVFDRLVARGKLPASPFHGEASTEPVLPGIFRLLKQGDYSAAGLVRLLRDGLKDSRMVLRWLFFGLVLATAIRAFVPMDSYQNLFGPTLLGLLLTTFFATIIEVCSEGSTPIAADLVTRAMAPGNGFTFLMAGVATDYTEVMVIKDTTKSWKIALFLPLISLPQVLVIGWLLNTFGV